MTLAPKHWTALELLVSARVAAGGERDPRRAEWLGLLDAVRKARAANDTTPVPLVETPLGPLVFAISLPLQVEKPRKKPRILFAAPGQEPAAIRGKLATKLFGSAKAAKAALRSWEALPAGASVSFKGGQITADWSPVVIQLAPTMNTLRGMPVFSKQNARKIIAERIAAERARWPDAHWGGQREAVQRGKSTRMSPVGGKRRYVRVTRFSSRRPDDLGPDAMGAKLALDQIVQAGILGDDSDAWCERKGQWEPANPKEGMLVLEVFELVGESGVPRPASARKKPA